MLWGKRAAVLVGVIGGALVGCEDVPIDEPQDVDAAVVDAPSDTQVADSSAADAPLDTEVPDIETDAPGLDAPADVGEAGDAGCASGALCADGTICKAGACVACAKDDECTAIHPSRRCYAGVCKFGNCKPAETDTGCTAPGAACCETESTGGTCFSRLDEKSCCTDAACAGLGKLTKCILPHYACGCPPPAPGTLYVSPTGIDSNVLRGNGSADCPFKTIGEALNTATTATTPLTIVLRTATTGPTVYGTGCTGGSPCDSTPVSLPAEMVKGVTIKGDGSTPADVVVTGEGIAVFDVRAPAVGFKNLTVVPTRVAVNGGGGTGIIFSGPAGTTAAPERSVEDVVIRGQYATSIVSGTGTGVLLNGSASPTLGPGLTIANGFLGVNITGPSRPTITGDATAPTTISMMGDNCVRATSTTATVPGFVIRSSDSTKSVLIKDCGSRAVSLDTAAAPTTPSRLEGVVIRKTSAGGAFDGVVVRTAASLALKGVDVINVTGRGVVVDAGSAGTKPVLSMKDVTISLSSGVSALFQGYGLVDVDNLVVETSASIGVQLAGFAELVATRLDVRDSAGIGVSLGGAGKATIDGLKVSGGSSAGAQILGTMIATVKNADLRDSLGGGLLVQGFAQATFDTLVMRGAKSYGVRVLESGDLTLVTGDVRESLLDGVRCEATAKLKLRKSTFLLNKANGVSILGTCAADLGSATEAGENVFNKTSLKNTTSGLCFTGTATPPQPSSSTFGCGNTVAPCTTPGVVPSSYLATATTCQANRDVTAVTTMLTLSSPKCCFD